MSILKAGLGRILRADSLTVQQLNGRTIRGDDALLFGGVRLTSPDAWRYRPHEPDLVSVRSGQDFRSRLPIPQGRPWLVPPRNRLYNFPNLYTPPAGAFQAVFIKLLCGRGSPRKPAWTTMAGATPALRGIDPVGQFEPPQTDRAVSTTRRNLRRSSSTERRLPMTEE